MTVAKGYKGIGMEGVIARWYAGLTQKNMNDFKNDAKRMTAYLTPGASVLEIAPGPGYLSVELARLGNYKQAGLDISQTFVEIAQANAKQAGVQIDFRQGNAAHVPFDANTFDLIICRAAFKNFSQPIDAINEMYRVLKPGGKAVIIDMRGDATDADLDREVDHMGLSGINAFATKFTFKYMLVKRAYTSDRFKEMIARSSFTHYNIVPSAIGLEICLEK